MAQNPTASAAASNKRLPATRKTPGKVTTTKPPLKAAAKPVRKPAVRPMSHVPHVAKPAKAAKPAKSRKIRLVRDSFTMPEAEHALIAALKKRCLAIGVAARKSELLRAAILSLADLDDRAVVIALRRLDVIKTGRPAKAKK